MSWESSDRGSTKAANQLTFKNRAKNFATWCEKIGFHDITFATTAQPDAHKIILAYALDIHNGSAALGTPLTNAGASLPTVRNYVHAAASFANAQNLKDPRFQYDIHGYRVGGDKSWFPALKEFYSGVLRAAGFSEICSSADFFKFF